MHGVNALRTRRVESGEDALERLPLLLYPGDGAGAGHGLDAPDPSRDATLLGRDERADVTSRSDVRPAAELHAEPGNRDDADAVAGLLAEQQQLPARPCEERP